MLEQIVITDAKGKPMIELGTSITGGRIVVHAMEHDRVIQVQAERLGGAVRTYRNDGAKATAMYTYPVTKGKVAGGIDTFGPPGQAATTLGSGDSGPYSVSMGAACDGGVLALSWQGDLWRVNRCLLQAAAATTESAEE